MRGRGEHFVNHQTPYRREGLNEFGTEESAMFKDETEEERGNVTLPSKSHRVTGRAGQEPKPVTEETRDFSVTLLGSKP